MAIARLRGEQLKQFDIPLCCIATLDEDEETPTRYAYVDDDFVLSVSKSPIEKEAGTVMFLIIYDCWIYNYL